MPTPPQLNVFRHDRTNRALITLTGEIDLTSAPLLRETLRQCLLDGIRAIDVDLTTVTFCDCSGLNAFINAARHTTTAGGTLRLHHPSPMLTRLFALTATGRLLVDVPAAPVRPPPRHSPAGKTPAMRPSLHRHETVPEPAPFDSLDPDGTP
jgi:anti-anti-sigma factor